MPEIFFNLLYIPSKIFFKVWTGAIVEIITAILIGAWHGAFVPILVVISSYANMQLAATV